MNNKIKSYFAKEPQVAAVYLFGSHARGKANGDSDVDIAILLKEGVRRDRHEDIALRHTCRLAALLKVDRVDILVLNSANPIVRHQVYNSGKLVFCRDKVQALRFKDLSSSEYLDFMYIRKAAEERVVRSLSGDFHG